ncbi:MAG: FGGY family carbohydrate kinase [Thermomicrobiales bacterium]
MTSTSPSDAVLALDLGTSALKAIAVDPRGQILAVARRSYPTHHPQPGWNEQDVRDWFQAATDAIRELGASLPDTRFAAIGITGQMHGTVLLDRQGQPLAPAVIWSDRRTVAARDEIAREVGDELPLLIGGPLGAGYQATTARWFADHRPAVAAEIGTVLLPKDALAHWLTGRCVTEPSDAVSTGLMNARTERWEPSLLAAARVTLGQLPEIVPSGTVIGTVLPKLAASLGLPSEISVVIGGGDAPCGALGAGVTATDQAMLMLSSGAQVILPTADDTPDPAARWHTFPSAVGPHQDGRRRNRVCATSNAGIALEWLGRITQTSVPEFLDQAGTIAPGAAGALFIPSLTGQRTPVLDPAARGTFYGLTDQHGVPELARAVAEGVVLACRHAFETMLGDRPRPTRLMLGGGPSQHPVVRQIVANIFDLPVQPLTSTDLTALGAARLAAQARGWPAFDLACDPAAAIAPDPRNRDLYDTLFAIHVDAMERSRDISHRLHAMAQE